MPKITFHSTSKRTGCLLLCLALAACGGGGDAQPAPAVITGSSDTQAGDERTGASVLVLPLIGPTIDADTAGEYLVSITGSATVTGHFDAPAVASMAMSKPAATSPSELPVPLGLAPVVLPIDYAAFVTVQPGATDVAAVLTIKAGTSAIAMATASASWTITRITP